MTSKGRRLELSPQHRAQIGENDMRIVAELAPSDSHDPPPIRLQQPIALSVPLERPPGSVRRPPVQLDDQPLLRPKAIDFEEPTAHDHVSVAARPWQIRALEQFRKPLLQLLASDAAHGGVVTHQIAKHGGPLPTFVALQEHWNRE
jgi:hypothetical protein